MISFFWVFRTEVRGLCYGFNIVILRLKLTELFVKWVLRCFSLRFWFSLVFRRLDGKFRCFFTDKIFQRNAKMTEFRFKIPVFFKYLEFLENLFILAQYFSLHTILNSPVLLMWRHELQNIRLKQQNQLSN